MFLTLALVAQSGCDLWCQHAEEARSAANSQGTAAPCHDLGEHQTPAPKQSSNHEIPKDCVHPQAVGDNPKFEAKVAKATPVAIAMVFPSIEIRFGAIAFTNYPAHVLGIKPPGTPVSPAVLRI